MQENHDLAKWLAGNMSDGELSDFEKSPEYAVYSKIKAYSAQLEAPPFQEAVLFEKVVANKKIRGKAVPLYAKFYKIAVAAAIVFALAYTAKFFLPTIESTGNSARKSFVLPDQSGVVLNAGSEISYTKWNWPDHRTLKLKGEAYFHVSKGSAFEVVTALGKVTVLGTQFNVRSRDGRLDVNCFEGRVKVRCNNRETIVNKGKGVAFYQNSEIEISDGNTEKPLWLSGEMAFTKEHLDHILAEIERQYNVAVQLKSAPENQLFTGVLPANNLDADISIIASIYHLQFVKVNSHKIILKAVDVQN